MDASLSQLLLSLPHFDDFTELFLMQEKKNPRKKNINNPHFEIDQINRSEVLSINRDLQSPPDAVDHKYQQIICT